MPIALLALQIPIKSSLITIAESSKFSNNLFKYFDKLDELPAGWYGVLEKNSSSMQSIYYTSSPANGFHNLQLYENKEYFLINPPSEPNTSGFELKQLPGENKYYRFSIKNYLGSASLSFENGESINFDVVSSKLRYADEYHSMVSSIASECNQLLLDWSTPTSLPFTPDPSQQKQILLEQFLFLRHVLSAERLDLYLEILRRNPHTTLAEEEVWKPAGTSAPVPEYFQNPMRYGRHYCTSVAAQTHPCPREIMTRRKYETLDTATNRFIRFALEIFRDICDLVIQEFNGQQGTAWREAHDMRNALDAFLADPFFSDVGRLVSIPDNNQTLMKREGYRQILHAWLMLETAAQLDWPGREDAYDGTKRDVPTLYEFWLYFVFRKLLSNIENLNEIEVTKHDEDPSSLKPFIIKDEKGLRINLKRGQTSVSAFRWSYNNNNSLRVHFYFDREFGQNKEVLANGTYSRAFRPDYTLVIFPDPNPEIQEIDINQIKENENNSEQEGKIVYLHFDAKYRVERLNDFFGSQKEHERNKKDYNEVDIEKEEAKSTNTYRRGDLYKMHTYNEAIRRTVGSYVIYPGTDNLTKDDRLFRRYHEILPGVGAFVLRPITNGTDKKFEAAGKETLLEFIKDVLHIQQNRFSQLHRLSYWTHDTIKESSPLAYSPRNRNDILANPKSVTSNEKPPADTNLLVGYIRPEVISICHDGQLFYYHAIDKNGETVSIDPRVFHADYFLPYTTNGKLLGWVAKIKDTKLSSRKDLLNYLGVNDDGNILKSNSKYYYLVTFCNTYKLDIIPESISEHLKVRKRPPFVISWKALFQIKRQ